MSGFWPVLFLTSVMLISAFVPQGEKPVTNEDVVAMVKSGLQEETILQAIEVNEAAFDTSPEALQVLKDAGVSARVLRAIELAMRGRTGAPKPHEETGELPEDPGMYVRQGGTYVELHREAVEWEGGVDPEEPGTKVWTYRLAVVKGPQSRTQLLRPFELFIVSPQGISASGYGLFRAQEEKRKDRRRFRVDVVVEGPRIRWREGRQSFVAFGVERIAPRTYKVRLTQLEPGEYAFVPPGPMDQSSGIVHTFGVR